MQNYFPEDELECQHCGEYLFDENFLNTLNKIREECDFPLPISSGYRCKEHPIEAAKAAQGRPYGAHTTGKAVDVKVSGERALRLIEVALAHGVKRIGLNQKGSSRFIHLDVCDDLPTPALWTY